MTVQTHRITWGLYKGSTKVIVTYAGRNMPLIYRDRKDAVALLKALRKRVR